MTAVMKTKLTMKDLANPKAIAALDDKVTEMLMGSIIGIARSYKAKLGANGEPTIALIGDFEGTPADPRKETIRSGLLYLHEGFLGPIMAGIDAGNAVNMAVEIYAVRATNAAGYSFALKSIAESGPADPLAELRRMVEEAKAKQIAPPKDEPKTPPAAPAAVGRKTA